MRNKMLLLEFRVYKPTIFLSKRGLWKLWKIISLAFMIKNNKQAHANYILLDL